RYEGARAGNGRYTQHSGREWCSSGAGRMRRGGTFVQETGLRNSAYGADKFGFADLSVVHWNLTAPTLYEHAIAAREASLVEGGPICAETGVHTGRSPKDKHTV